MADSTFETVGIKKDFKTQNIELNIGLSKDYFFGRNFCFTPSLSYQLGWVTLLGKHKLKKATSPNDNYDVDPSKDPYKSKSLSENKGVNVGGSLYINITHNFKLYFSGSYTVKLGTKVGDVFSSYILPESVAKSKSGAYLSSGIKILW